MPAPNPVVYADYVLIATAAHLDRLDKWRGAFHVSVDGQPLLNSELSYACDTREEAESEAIVAGRQILDALKRRRTVHVPYRSGTINIGVSPTNRGTYHATVSIDWDNHRRSKGFVEAAPAETEGAAFLSGLNAGRLALDAQLLE